ALRALGALAAGESDPLLVEGGPVPGRIAAVFPGQGAQRLEMGRELAARYPVFAAAFEKVCQVMDGLLPRPLREVVWGTEAALLDRTGWAQPALFTFEVALFRLLESWGPRPDLLIGHSVGEVAAAHVAGAVSLPDACTLVAARARLMEALPEGGAMIAVRATEEEVQPLLGAGVSVAAVNAPGSVVLSGDEEAVETLAARFAGRGRDTRRLTVSHAFHSPLMEPMLDEFAAAARGIEVAEPTIPLVSTVTGTRVTAAELAEPGYWTTQARHTVRFAAGIRTLRAEGAGIFLELGPDAALTAMVEDTLAEQDGSRPWLALPALRAGRDEQAALLTTLSTAHCAGAEPDWPSFFAGTGAALVDLPTYPFQHARYWPAGGPRRGDVTAVGLADAEHPLLGAVAELADGDGALFTSRLSQGAYPWLADHAVLGRVLLPGTAFVELALRAGAELGCGNLTELTLAAPLLLPADGEIALQVRVGAPDQDTREGHRTVTIHSRPYGAGTPWTLHATGTVAARPGTPGAPVRWPPEDAEPVDPAGCYEHFGAAGLGYGPAFRGLRAVWRRGEEVFAEVGLPEEVREQATRFGLHPVLLDSALHAIPLTGEHSGRLRLPFSWEGVTLHTEGASVLRVCLRWSGDTLAILATDERNRPVVTVDGLRLRAVSAEQLSAAEAADPVRDSLFQLDWTAAHPAGQETATAAVLGAGSAGLPARAVADLDELDPVPEVVVLAMPGESGRAPGDELPDSAHRRVTEALRLAQRWLAEDRFTGSRLVFLTRGAVPAGDAPADLAAAAVWGLVRSAQVEHPGRFGLLDLDDSAPPEETELARAVAATATEPQLALRDGELLAARLHRVPAAGQEGPAWDPAGTVLITGGTGTLAPHVARWLAGHGAEHLVLVSRGGPDSPRAEGLVAELAELGAEVEVVACDVTDLESLAGLRDDLRERGHEVRTVIHAAARIELCSLADTDLAAFARVLHAKVGGAANLDRVFGSDLDAFVLFSSVAGMWGTGQHAAYVAGNAYLHALAERRRACGLPATALSWGIWADDRESGRVDPGQIRRSGLEFMDPGSALAGLRRALDADDTTLALADIDWERYHPVYTSARPTTLFDEIPAVRARAEEAGQERGAPRGELADRLRTLPG
ncbi:SDR family NAD(P)-dependent oxidoreductase, partial [Amycolatopsis cihanbeyliensis]